MSTLVELKYGYDRASNRKYRLDEVATANSQHFDERYGYDGLNRLTAFDRGQLDVNGNNLTNATLGQTWSLDPTGNWNAFAQTVAGAFSTTRTHNEANEIEGIATPTGTPTWATPPDYDANGNMTDFPQPGSLGSSYVATYDAWNRLVKLEDGSGSVGEYQYDGLNRRITKTASNTVRHYYFSDRWQVLEERTGASTSADHQYVWGLRYVDDLVLRDRTSERLYALQDALFNVVALTDDTGDVKERFAYQPYGKSEPLNPYFTTYSGTNYGWEYRFTGRELDLESGLQINRYRYLHLELGRWLTRDPLEYSDGANTYQYGKFNPLRFKDPLGLKVSMDKSCKKDWLKECGKDPNVVKALKRYGLSCKAKALLIKCDDTLDAIGKYCCASHEVYLNPKKADCGALAHEIIHASDQCDEDICVKTTSGCGSFGSTKDGCRKLMCTEARAAAFGNCCDKTNAWRKNKTWKECVEALKKWYTTKTCTNHKKIELEKEWENCQPKDGNCCKPENDIPPQPKPS